MRAIDVSLRGLGALSRSPQLNKLGLTSRLEEVLYRGSKASVVMASEAARQVQKAAKLLEPLRMKVAGNGAGEGDTPQTEKAPRLFDLTLTESQQMMKESMARFADERLRKYALPADEACAPPASFFEECQGLGLTQLAVPEALGGAGETREVTTNVLVAEELARGDMGLALAALAPLGVVHALVDLGTAEQQAEYLPAFVGERFYPAALALLEPHPLFDPDALETRAALHGDSYVVSGTKSMVPLAEDAELFLVIAATDHGPRALLIPKGAEGLRVRPEPTMGLRSAKLGTVELHKVKVPRRQALGGAHTTADVERLVDLARIAWGALAVGTGSALLDYVKTYCNDRVAFGEPITHRQSVAFAIADIALELDALRLLVYRAASRAEQGLSFHREAMLVRVQAADKGMQMGTNGVQLLGGHGFVKEHPVELWYRHMRGLGIAEGGVLV